MIEIPLGCGGFIEELCRSSYIVRFDTILIGTIIANILFFMFGNLLPIIKKWNWSIKDLTERCLLAFNIYIIFRVLSSSYLEWFIKHKDIIIIFGIAISFIWLIIFLFKNINKKIKDFNECDWYLKWI